MPKSDKNQHITTNGNGNRTKKEWSEGELIRKFQLTRVVSNLTPLLEE